MTCLSLIDMTLLGYMVEGGCSNDDFCGILSCLAGETHEGLLRLASVLEV